MLFLKLFLAASLAAFYYFVAQFFSVWAMCYCAENVIQSYFSIGFPLFVGVLSFLFIRKTVPVMDIVFKCVIAFLFSAFIFVIFRLNFTAIVNTLVKMFPTVISSTHSSMPVPALPAPSPQTP